jgi:hypothetical protein
MKEFKTESVLQYIGKQRQKWRDHVNRMVRRGSPNTICSTRLGGENLQNVRQKDGLRP